MSDGDVALRLLKRALEDMFVLRVVPQELLLDGHIELDDDMIELVDRLMDA